MTFKIKLSLFFPMCVLLWFTFYDLYLPIINSGISILGAIFIAILLFPKELILSGAYKKNFELSIIILIPLIIVIIRSYLGSTEYLFTFTKIVVISIATLHLAYSASLKLGANYVLNIGLLVLLLQALSPLFFFASSSYQDLVNFFQAPDILERDMETRGALALRRSFLSGSGGFFGMSAPLGLASFFVVILYTKYKLLSTLKFLILFGALTCSAILAGRIAIVFTIASLFFIFIHARPLLRIIMCVLGLLSLTLLYNASHIVYLLSENFVIAYWALEPLRNYFEAGTISSHSTSTLADMFFLPELRTILFGDGRYISDDGLFYGDTDSGFMRQMLFGGIFFVLSNLIVLIFILKPFNFLEKFFLFFCIILMHIKGNFLMGSPTGMAILIFFSTVIHQLSLQRNK